MGRVSHNEKQQYEVLLSAEFSGHVDSWTEYLCLEKHPDGSITLTSRSREILAEAGTYIDEAGSAHLPRTINKKAVYGIDGDFVVGEELVPHDSGAELRVSARQIDLAREWLAERKWQEKPDFREAWLRVRAALSGDKRRRLPNNPRITATQDDGRFFDIVFTLENGERVEGRFQLVAWLTLPKAVLEEFYGAQRKGPSTVVFVGPAGNRFPKSRGREAEESMLLACSQATVSVK